MSKSILFYCGLTKSSRDKLDCLNGDSFLFGTIAECHNSLTNHSAKKSEMVVLKKVTGVLEVDQVMTINAKIDFLVQYVLVACKECGKGHQSDQCPYSVESTHFVSNVQRSQNNLYSDTYNYGYQEGMQQQAQWLMPENKSLLDETLMQFIANRTATFKLLDTQIGKLANGINFRPWESLPSNIETNHRRDGNEQCQVVTLCNGRKFQKITKKLQKQKEKSLSKKSCLGDYEMVILYEECSAIIQKKLPPKFKSHGSFTTCTIRTHFSGRALCNLGANINLVPYSIYKKLGLENAEHIGVTLLLDVLVKADKFIFPANFIILNMEVDSEVLVTLGRPFLTISRTFIYAKNGELIMRVHDQQVSFNILKPINFPK
ncbi:hypothetical protein CDL12_04110 [Handroanthus impetiginosus]|uniref:Uncharacterized protein n=1 Tax=Handroanthus impetiginosus TaxID=429701 RepID=A0A2G9I081_9LAMI|nr:hypothetical protein CDL12_04110 [Handroanthus impetiginosus]